MESRPEIPPGTLYSLSNDETIYAVEPWSCKAEAVVALEPADGQLPTIAASRGMRYFLEVSVAKEFLDGWERAPADPEARCARLIRYARHDA